MEDAIAKIWNAIQSAELDDIPAIAAYLITETKGDVQMNKNQAALEELIYGLKLAHQALWSPERIWKIAAAALAHCQPLTTEDEEEQRNEKAIELVEEDGAAIPLTDVQHSLDDAARHLTQMNRQDKLGQWLAYLFESLEESIGVAALHDVRSVLRTRFNNRRW